MNKQVSLDDLIATLHKAQPAATSSPLLDSLNTRAGEAASRIAAIEAARINRRRELASRSAVDQFIDSGVLDSPAETLHKEKEDSEIRILQAAYIQIEQRRREELMRLQQQAINENNIYQIAMEARTQLYQALDSARNVWLKCSRLAESIEGFGLFATGSAWTGKYDRLNEPYSRLMLDLIESGVPAHPYKRNDLNKDL